MRNVNITKRHMRKKKDKFRIIELDSMEVFRYNSWNSTWENGRFFFRKLV